MKSKKIIFALLAALVFSGICASCNKNNEVAAPKNCVVKLVKNINPLLAGDTIVMAASPGTILQNVPTLSKSGKTFGGWFTSDTQIAASAFDIVNTPIYLDKILYAKWN